jgi:hypothetical protein
MLGRELRGSATPSSNASLRIMPNARKAVKTWLESIMWHVASSVKENLQYIAYWNSFE